MNEVMSMDGVTIETEFAPTRLYRRDLPGAGYVVIDATHSPADDTSDGDAPRSRIRVYVERRGSEERRAGHAPPVLAEFTGDRSAAEVGELYRMAADNVALARALLEWQSRHQRELRAD
jgi:hypothetical protein